MEEDKIFGGYLKAIRMKANKTVSEISAHLEALGYKASVKTIYSWESGNSQPTPSALLDLCRFCEVDDVLTAFGYTASAPDKGEETLIKIYRALNDTGKQNLLDQAELLISSPKYTTNKKTQTAKKNLA